MKVSVSLITYNHAPYIRQAIESVLMQKTNFDFELLIGEDDSNDGTRDIVREYEAKYPGKIRAFYHQRKDAVMIGGKPSGRRNWVNNLKNTRGQYVALLDGDDYWTSPYKLQKQVDYLDQHPECALCFHLVEVLNQEGKMEPFRLGPKKSRYTLEDLLQGEFHIPTGGVMFRNRLFGDFPSWIFETYQADTPLHTLNSQHGDIGYIDEVLGVYRIHGGGIWTGGDNVARPKSEKERKAAIWRTMGMVVYYETVNRHLGFKYDRIIREKLSMWYYTLVWEYRLQGDFEKMREFLGKALKAKVFNRKTPRAFVIKSVLFAYLPWVYRAFAGFKKSPKVSATETKEA